MFVVVVVVVDVDVIFVVGVNVEIRYLSWRRGARFGVAKGAAWSGKSTD